MQLEQSPPSHGVSLDPFEFKDHGEAFDSPNIAKVREVAQKYSQIWHSGDPSQAGDFLASDLVQMNGLTGSTQHGVQEFQQLIKNIYEVGRSHLADLMRVWLSALRCTCSPCGDIAAPPDL